jgi:uncharacterized protein (TIGR02001 family)
MKSIKVLSALSLLALAGTANAEVTGSMGIASSYLWRGYDLGSGTPAVSGDLKFSASGFYTGVWASSGDTLNGTEYDLYAGYGGSVGEFKYDVSYWTYSYPTGSAQDDLGTPGKLSELVTSFGYGPVSVFYLKNLATPGDGDGDYSYYGLKGTAGAFTATLGQHDLEDSQELTHFDVSYAYNSNLSFTVSIPVGVADGYEKPSDPTIIASYSVPFGK